MCGIAGIVASQSNRYKHHLQKMISSLHHRGPDNSGEYSFKNCLLGHTRLKIVDLFTGKQPMLSVNSKLGITFNGEIYGYKDIKKEISYYPFQTTSDTEVILALYERSGEDFITKLPGMFAFAIWDDQKRTLFCARDRFGEKPFYYAYGINGEFIFASEIKAILATGLVKPVLDRGALVHYLQYLYVHPYQTIYSNIYTIPPAHYLKLHDGKVDIKRYWYFPEIKEKLSWSDAIDEFRYLLERAVARQLVADVPVGAFLSGGLDSSTIVALASKYDSKLKTFSFGFEEATSELPFAKDVANQYGTDHQVLYDSKADIFDLLIKMQDIYDEPFADSSNIPTYLISKLAKEHCKVVLSGDGADELLGGYDYWYRALFKMQSKINAGYLEFLLLRIIKKFASFSSLTVPNTLNSAFEDISLARQYGSILGAHKERKKVFRDIEILNMSQAYHFTKGLTSHPFKIRNSLDDALREDLFNYLPGDILVKTDMASMSNGLELRTPFLDVDFAAFCMTLQYKLKINSVTDKLILREAFKYAWPASLHNRHKQGFGAPVHKWLKHPKLKDLKYEYLHDSKKKIFFLLDFEHCTKIAEEDNYKTWILLVLSLWLESHSCEI
jgi:asparagine synthase (glutamine-hydrolysing)